MVAAYEDGVRSREEDARRSLVFAGLSPTQENVERLLLGARACEEPICQNGVVTLHVKVAGTGMVRSMQFSAGSHRVERVQTVYIIGSMLRNAAARGDRIFVDPDCKRKLPNKC